MPIPDSVAAFRARHRDEHVPEGYPGWLHLGATVGGALALAALAASQLDSPGPVALATVPLAFLFANLGEYLGHRYPMHRRVPGIEAMFKGHAGMHHRFFTNEAMAGESQRDFHVTLFGPLQLGFFLGALGLPPALLLGLVLGPDVGLLFAITALLYFASYECMHLAYHFPESSWLSRVPGLPWLRHHHLVHHNPALMSRYNFNITWPIWDLLIGSRWTGPADVTGKEVKAMERERLPAG